MFDRKKPNLIVHLDVSPEESLRRIRMRKRDCEADISLDYLQKLRKAYEEFLSGVTRIIPVIRVNYEKFRTTDEMAEMIVRYRLSAQQLSRYHWHCCFSIAENIPKWHLSDTSTLMKNIKLASAANWKSHSRIASLLLSSRPWDEALNSNEPD